MCGDNKELGASPTASDRATAVEPVPVSPLRDGIPDADDERAGLEGKISAAQAFAKRDTERRALEAENFALAAGQCVVENGLLGDDHGHFYCEMKRQRDELLEALGHLTALDSDGDAGCWVDPIEYGQALAEARSTIARVTGAA